MQILPLKFIREDDKHVVGINLYNLAKLSHLGLPVIESVVVIPPVNLFTKIINKYRRTNSHLIDNLNNIKAEIMSLEIPETLKSFEMVNFFDRSKNVNVDIEKLWENLLNKWVYELTSKIERGEKDILHLTSQLVVFSANFSDLGLGFFDEDRGHVSIKRQKESVDSAISFETSSEIENLILLANQKLVIPQIYHWVIEDGKVKIIKILPFTQSLPEKKETSEVAPAILPSETKNSSIKTATKIFLDYSNEILSGINADGIFLRVSKNDSNSLDETLNKLLELEKELKVIFYPQFDGDNREDLEFAKMFLFFRNKRKIDAQIVLPKTFSLDEYLNLKRELASIGIYSKGSLKIWKQFSTLADFYNLDNYLEAGFDGAIIDLDEIAKIVCGIDAETFLKQPRIDWISAMENFFKELHLSKIMKNHKQVLLIGKLTQNEELLNYFIKSGVWGLAFEKNLIEPMREHISFLEKQAIKKLNHAEVKH